MTLNILNPGGAVTLCHSSQLKYENHVIIRDIWEK